MSRQNQQQDVAILPFVQLNWAGGINTSVPPDRLQDGEAVDILNFEFSQDSNLIVRSGTAKFNNPGDTHATRITSIHYYENDAGNIHILHTASDQLYRTANTGGARTNITGALSFPVNTIWHWRNFGGLAIGVNGATTASGFTNPIKVSGAGPTVAALTGTPPKAKFIEIWNNRVWVVDADNPNTLRASALNNAEDWTTAGAAGTITIDVSKNDGDRITGIIAFRERLFVFKRSKIFVVSADGVPNTDPANLRVDIYSSDLGCFAQNTIRIVLNDVLFLSESGVASLISSEVVGNFNAALLSRNVAELSNYLRNSDGIHAFVVDNADQYWLQIPAASNPKGINETYVLDYRNIQQGLIRWLRFDGKVSGTATTSFYINGSKQYLVGTNSGESVYRLQRYIPKDRTLLVDDGLVFPKRVTTKAFNLEKAFDRKEFLRFYLNVILISSVVDLIITYQFDDDGGKRASLPAMLEATVSGALWGTAIWGTSLWYTNDVVNKRIRRRFKQTTFGRKAVKVQFEISNSSNQSFVLGDLGFDFAFLNDRLGNNIK